MDGVRKQAKQLALLSSSFLSISFFTLWDFSSNDHGKRKKEAEEGVSGENLHNQYIMIWKLGKKYGDSVFQNF